MSTRRVVSGLAVAVVGLLGVMYVFVFYTDNICRRRFVHRKVHYLAAAARAHPSDPRYAKKLIFLARGKYSFEATAATVAIGTIGVAATSVVLELSALLKSSNPYVSREAALSLGKLGDLSAPALADLNDAVINGDPEKDATWFAADAIGKISPPGIQEIQLLRSGLGRSRRLDEFILDAISKLEDAKKAIDGVE